VNYFNKLLPPRQLRIPLLGLLLIFGSVFAYRAKPVLSTQMEYLRTLTASVPNSQTYTWLQRNPAFDAGSIRKEAHLRRKLGFQSSLKTVRLHNRKLGFQSSLKTVHLHRIPGLQSSLKIAHLKKAIAKSPHASESLLVASNQEQTYTWLQRNSPALAANPQAPVNQAKVAPKANFPQHDGVYLYGQSPRPGQLGQGYIVFEKQQDNVVGALYIPSSELSCFNGTLYPSGELAMTVRGYVGESSPTQVATNNTIPRLNDDEPTTYAHSIALQDYYQLNSVSPKDRQILQMCKTNK